MIAIKVFIDIQGDGIYFVWEGDLKITKIDIKSGEFTSFGYKTPALQCLMHQ